MEGLITEKVQNRLSEFNQCKSEENKVNYSRELIIMFENDIILLEGPLTIKGQIEARKKARKHVLSAYENINSDLLIIHNETLRILEKLK